MVEEIKLSNEDKRKFHKYTNDRSGQEQITGVKDFEVVSYVLQNYSIIQLSDKSYVYEGGSYKFDPYLKKIGGIISKCLFDCVKTARKITDITKLLLMQSSIDKTIEEVNNYPKNWVVFANGMFDPIEWKMYPHKAEYLAVNQINFNFDSTKDFCNDGTHTLDILLNYLIPDEDNRKTVLQYFGYSFVTDFKYQKLLSFVGRGRTGKSELLSLLANTLGTNNIAACSLEDLASKRFAPAELFLKVANLCGDISRKMISDTTMLKVVTGHDTISGEFKGKDAFRFKSYAKEIFSCNSFPEINESSNAFYDRLLLVQTCHEKDRVYISDITKKLQAEKDYFIYRCMKALSELYRQNGFTESQACRNMVNEIRSISDSIYSFTTERLSILEGSKIYTKKSTMFDAYKEFCESEIGEEPVSKKELHRSLQESLGKCVTIDGYPSYKNVMLKSEFQKLTPEEVKLVKRIY